MGLFGSKKKEKAAQAQLPPLKFPDLPQEESPEAKQAEISPEEASAIKKAVSPAPQIQPPAEMEPTEMEPMGGEKPLFVRVEKYREVMATINELKEKLKDAGDILTELNRIKNEEEQELSSWQEDLEAIKERLITVDKTLFE